MGVVHTVVQGESLSLIALAYGLRALDWPLIYDHPENAAFRALRPDPNLIHPGDRVYVPTDEAPGSTLPTRRRHRVRLGGPARIPLRVTLRDRAGRPHAHCAYKLVVGDEVLTGTTVEGGLVDVQVPAGQATATLELTIAPGVVSTWSLQIGHLDPIDTTSGLQGRLKNLGHDPGPIDGLLGPKTEAAVRAFQAAHGLTVDGVAGPRTLGVLEEVHGC